MSKSKAISLGLVFVFALWLTPIPSLMGTSPPRLMSADAGDTWTTPVNISQTSWETFAARGQKGLVVDPDGNLHFVYHADDGVTSSSSEIFYVNNASGSWSTPLNVTQNNREDRFPVIGVDSQGNIHIVYAGYQIPTGDREIFYVNKTESGFSAPVNVSVNTLFDSMVSMAIDSQGYVHLVWESDVGDIEIFYANNVGGSWSSPLNLTSNDINDEQPTVAIDSQGKVHIAWEMEDDSPSHDEEIGYATNAGGSWVITNVTQNDIDDYLVSIGIDGSDSVHLAFSRYNSTSGNRGAFYVSKTGTGWGTAVNISATNEYVSFLSVAVDGEDGVHVAFSQYDGTDREIYYVNNTAGAWGTPVNVTRNASPTDDYRPNMVIGRWGYAHIVYYEFEIGDFDVFYVRSTEAVGPSAVTGPIEEFPIIWVIVGVPVAAIAIGIAAFLLRRR